MLTLDGQKLHYYNQREDVAGDDVAGQEPAGPGYPAAVADRDGGHQQRATRFGGRWGLVRMLERAHVEPVDSANYQLTWQARPGAGTALGEPGAPKAAAGAGRCARPDLRRRSRQPDRAQRPGARCGRT
ncbi:type VI secretion IcmF C-terminal domain-containing protein [Cupriavidus basilensis]